MDIMAEESSKFIYGDDKFEGSMKKSGISEADATKLWADMAEFGKYAFNKSHAAAYAAITMQTAYLKCHHPKEFYAGLLTSVMDKTDTLAIYVKECKKKGISILLPDINTSKSTFTLNENGDLTYGLASIKKLGEGVVAQIEAEREKNGKYTGLYDFIERVPSANAGAITNLILAGAFDGFGYNRPTLVENIKPIKDKIKKDAAKKSKQPEGQLSLFDIAPEEMVSKTPNYEMKIFPDFKNAVSMLMQEKEATGMFLSKHPLEETPFLDIDYTPLSEIAKIGQPEKTEDEYVMADKKPMFDLSVLNKTELSKGDKVFIHGIVTDIDVRTTVTGQKYKRLTIEDDTSSLSVFLFSNTLDKYDGYEKDDILTITGTISQKDGFVASVTANHIAKETELDKGLYIKLKGDDIGAFSEVVKQALYTGHNEFSKNGKKIPYNLKSHNLYPVYVNATKEQAERLHLTQRAMLVCYIDDYQKDAAILSSRFEVLTSHRVNPAVNLNRSKTNLTRIK